jgi:hypothetical protein
MGWSLDSLSKREKPEAAKTLQKCAAHPSSAARLVRPLVNGCAMTIFFDFSVVAKSLSKNIYGKHSRRADGTEEQSFGFHEELFLIM